MDEWSKYVDETGLIEDELMQAFTELFRRRDYVLFFEGLRFFQNSPTDSGDLEEFDESILNLIRESPTNSPFHYESIRLDFRTHPEDKIKQLKWWRVCTDQKDSYIQFYFQLSQHDREQEVRNILWDGDSLKAFYRTHPGSIYTQLTGIWFLRRYDRQTAKRIINALPRESNGLNPFWAVSTAVAFVLFLLTREPVSFLHIYDEDRLFLAGSAFWNGLSRLLMCTIYGVAIGKAVEIYQQPARMRLMFPRLLCATFVGYVILIIGSDVWTYSITISGWIRLPIIIGALGAALLYLKAEIDNTVGETEEQKRKKVSSRAWDVWIRGCFYSLGIGLLLMDLFGVEFIKHNGMMEEAKGNLLLGYFGFIEWRVFLLLSCVAFLVGVFVQIFWEDKPITEPL
jgi:hypothetical protein